jgi:hypothetical protein
MDPSKFYKEKGSGKTLGRFLFAAADCPEGAGRGRAGTLFYFIRTNDAMWTPSNGVIKTYTNHWDTKHPPVPEDLEEVASMG